jgi:hypothetical protein
MNSLIYEISNKFKSTSYSREEKLRVQKFEQDYKSVPNLLIQRLEIYYKLLQEYEKQKSRQIRSLRNTLYSKSQICNISAYKAKTSEQNQKRNNDKRNNSDD